MLRFKMDKVSGVFKAFMYIKKIDFIFAKIDSLIRIL